MLENGTHTKTPQQDAVARAMEASRRLLDAATKARNACFEAAQESAEVLGIQGVQEKFAAAVPVDWSKLMDQSGFTGTNPLGEQWQKALGGEWQNSLGALDADELVAAGKRVCLECVDSYEQAMLAAIDLRERIAEATNIDWMRSMASTRAGVERDVTRAYVATVRGFLN
jgi:hypothetical protein